MKKPTPLGKLIRRLRVDLSITQKTLADQIGSTSSFISAVEVGRRTLSSEKINLIIEKFVVPEEMERKLRAFALIQSPSFTMTIPHDTMWERRKLAYLFSKKLPTISDSTVEKIVELLNLDKGK